MHRLALMVLALLATALVATNASAETVIVNNSGP
jgi:hypothetical protein